MQRFLTYSSRTRNLWPRRQWFTSPSYPRLVHGRTRTPSKFRRRELSSSLACFPSFCTSTPWYGGSKRNSCLQLSKHKPQLSSPPHAMHSEQDWFDAFYSATKRMAMSVDESQEPSSENSERGRKSIQGGNQSVRSFHSGESLRIKYMAE